jgi:lipopolysaccharide/colanic/teichoic acid biosynthesis glycosyltransferase
MYPVLKRLVDIIIGIIALVILSPIILVTAVAIKINSKGPILADTPSRVGKDGHEFRMFKFRSMVANAHDILVNDPSYKKLLTQYKKGGYKLKNDPRITPVGRFIRKYSLDEIPQFLNVLKGDMSVVGPRAYYPDELRDQQKEYPNTKGAVKIVLSAKPGITGVWQVAGRSQINFDKRIQLDADYAKKQSILYDFYIMLKTPIAVLSGKGAM